ncbi:MAG: acyltransferase family protein [Candidatus Methanoperedens sp.]|nr:acyltransferase family protein [Candidatus Methanoperedens sp.]
METEDAVLSTTFLIKDKKMSKDRLLFIDNLRILLIVLVILVHLAITYGAPVGDWYYQEVRAGMIESIIYVFFIAVSQSFFMGFFFLISGYFTPGSFDRKGARHFFKDRLLRLGIPLLFYIIFIDPLIVYVLALSEGFTGSFLEFLGSYMGNYRGLATGPLWFVEALLIFAVIYAICRLLVKNTDREGKIPGNTAIAIFAFILGIVTFIVRIWFPIGWYFELLHLQISFFPQYIALFIIGPIACRGNWFVQISEKTGKLWSWIAVALLILFPVLLLLYISGDPALLAGGLSWQSFTYALWEQFIGVAIIVALTVTFREKYNNQGRLLKAMSKSAYTVYIFHAPVIVFLALILRGVIMDPLLKFVFVAPLAVNLCFLIGNHIRKLPIARNIL